MNNRDIEILKQNYEKYRERLKNSIYKEDMDISSSCFVSFGTSGLTAFKFNRAKCRWKKKTINDWKNLSFDEFMKKFRETEWEWECRG